MPREGGAWPGSLTQAGHTLLGSQDLGRGSFLAWTPVTQMHCHCPHPGPGLWDHAQRSPPGLPQDPGAEGRSQRPGFKSKPCAVLP